MLEIKYRGPLTEEQARSLVRYLHKNAKLLSSGWEKALYLDTSIFPQIGDFATGFSRISFKSDQKGIRLRIKEGNPSDAKRKERQLKIQKNDLRHFLFLLDLLGVHQGFDRSCFRKVYKLGRVKISIKAKCAIGTHFELELPSEGILQSETVRVLVQRFHLKVWGKKTYQQKIKEGMQKLPAIDIQRTTLLSS